MKKISIIQFTGTVAVSFLPMVSYAQVIGNTGGGGNGALATSNLSKLVTELTSLANKAILLLAAVAILVFIGTLIKYLATAEDSEARKEWRNYMIYAVIAFAVISGLAGLVNVTLSVFGLQNTGPTLFNSGATTQPSQYGFPTTQPSSSGGVSVPVGDPNSPISRPTPF